MKKILTGIVFAAVMVLAACSGGDTQMSEEDAALRQELIGVWFYPDSAVYDEDGDLTSFSTYQFTDSVLKRHDVENERITSYLLDKYTIKDGKFVVQTDGQKQYALINIEEIEEYGIPSDKTLDSEAELLGIETTKSDNTVETEAAAETSAASEE